MDIEVGELQLVSIEVEVFGQVQGCYFTKSCKELAEQLGVVGWVKNSKTGTIVGKLQGAKRSVDHMIDWLSTTGSPGCKIERCQVSNFEYLARVVCTLTLAYVSNKLFCVF